MSVVCVITPVVIASWPIITTIATAAGAKLGFVLLKDIERKKQKIHGDDIEIIEDDSQILKETLKEEEMVFVKGDLKITLSKDERDKIKICVNGKNKNREELKKIGKEFSNKIKQQFAYFKVKEEMKKKGYSLVQEEMEKGKIKLILRKY